LVLVDDGAGRLEELSQWSRIGLHLALKDVPITWPKLQNHLI